MIADDRLPMQTWEAGFAAADGDRLVDLRRAAAAFLGEQGVPAGTAADVEVVLAELVTNALEQRPSGPIGVGVGVTDAEVRLWVRNRRTAEALSPPDEWVAPELLADRGRGLQIVKALTSGVWVESGPATTAVTCSFARSDAGGR